MRDQLGIIDNPAHSEALASSVPDTAGCYFVPAFGGLLAPHWRDDARGVILGLTAYTGKAHIARYGKWDVMCVGGGIIGDEMPLFGKPT